MKLKKPLLSIFLLIVTLCVYRQAATHGFCLLDDGDFVVNNPFVAKGLTLDGVAWAFSSFETGNWHPVTWLSHMLDVRLFGTDAGGHHLVNIFLHGVNTLLVFLLFIRYTTALRRSFFVAMLFAVHPLHVESVAWVAERKDLLSAFFFFITLLAWERYVRKSTPLRYLAALFLYALGLMAKPMLVTLPIVLLILEWWPLGRFGGKQSPARLLGEKLPFFSLALASCWVTLVAQQRAGALATLAGTPLAGRLGNALTSYGVYLRKMVWPNDLAILYPLQAAVSWWPAAGWGMFLATLTLIFLRLRDRYPYLLAGWIWYLVMLFPVIGIVQVGGQALADRYTYLPLLGPFIMISWGGADWAAGRKWRPACMAAAVLAVGIFSLLAWRQVGFWKNDILLFSRAVVVTPVNPLARMYLAKAHLNKGIEFKEKWDYAAALEQFAAAAAGSTGDVAAMAHNNMGLIHAMQGRTGEAEREYGESLRYSSTYADPWYNLGLLYLGGGRYRQAADCFREVLRLNPEDGRVLSYLLEAQQRSGGTPGVGEGR